MKIPRILAIVTALFFSAQSFGEEPPRPSFSTSESVLVTAVVEAIDHETREVTLKRGDGEVITFTASDEARNLSEVVAGDILVAEHTVTFSVEVLPNEENLAPAAAEVAAAARTDKGELPGGMVLGATVVTATVEDIDMEANTFKLRFADGVVQEFVARNPNNLERSNVGDHVVMTTTESVGVIVEHTTQSE